jgi:hypothetical protein
VFDAPRRARAFFEALIADNLDIGRPANVEIIFGRRIRRDTPGVFRTAIDRPAVGPDTGGVVLNLFYKHSRVKQYLKDGRAMRIETVINSPRDLACLARLPHLGDLVPLENRIWLVIGSCSAPQAACVYSLIRPPRTGFRRICCVSMLGTPARRASRSSGTCCAMPW